MLPIKKKCTLLSVNVFSTKVLIRTLYFTSPNGDGTTILRGHPSHAKVQPPAGQRKYLHFSVILRPWVLVRPRESNPRPPALQSSALPTELIPPRSKKKLKSYVKPLSPSVEIKFLRTDFHTTKTFISQCHLHRWYCIKRKNNVKKINN